MTIVIACLDNERRDFPPLDFYKVMHNTPNTPFKIPKTEHWNPTINRNCSEIIIAGPSLKTHMVSLVKIRGVIYDLIRPNLDEIRIYGVRCPIHSVKKIGNIGNKTVVDIVFATDPTSIRINKTNNEELETATCSVKFPVGFNPICYASSMSEFQYISAVFQEIGLISMDISPVSFILLWNMAGKCTVSINSVHGRDTLVDQTHKLEVLNVEPQTLYDIVVTGDEKTYTLQVKTPEMTVNEMNKLYKSKRDENGIHDVSLFKPDIVKFMRKEGILSSGDKINIRGDTEFVYSANVVKSGETCSAEGNCNLYIVPDFDVNEMQFLCVETKGISHMIHFDRSESYVKYRDRVYPHNSNFRLENHMVTVAKGSIILVLYEDDDPLPFPGGVDGAQQVLSSGDMIVKDLVIRSTSHVTDKLDGETTYGLSSFFVYDSSDSSTLECSRISHGLDDNKETGSIAVSVLYTNPSLVQSLVQTIGTTPSQTTFTSRTDDTDELTATFGTDGLSFDTNEGNIFFGSGKEFRIHYQEEVGLDPAMLQIQRLDGGSYVTSFLVTAEPP